MEVRTLEFDNLGELSKAFERLATDARVEFCEADPTRLSLRFALGLEPVLPATRPDLSGRRSRLAR